MDVNLFTGMSRSATNRSTIYISLILITGDKFLQREISRCSLQYVMVQVAINFYQEGGWYMQTVSFAVRIMER